MSRTAFWIGFLVAFAGSIVSWAKPDDDLSPVTISACPLLWERYRFLKAIPRADNPERMMEFFEGLETLLGDLRDRTQGQDLSPQQQQHLQSLFQEELLDLYQDVTRASLDLPEHKVPSEFLNQTVDLERRTRRLVDGLLTELKKMQPNISYSDLISEPSLILGGREYLVDSRSTVGAIQSVRFEEGSHLAVLAERGQEGPRVLSKFLNAVTKGRIGLASHGVEGVKPFGPQYDGLVEVKIMGKNLSDRLLGCMISGKLVIIAYVRKQKDNLSGLEPYHRICKQKYAKG